MYDIDLVFSPFPTARKCLQNPLYSLANTTSGLGLWGQYEFFWDPLPNFFTIGDKAAIISKFCAH